MQPNTPHFVLTLQSAICHSGHFYAMSTIQDMIFRVYHSFVVGKKVTNIQHNEDARLLLQRLLIYTHYTLIKCGIQPELTTTPHIPDISVFEGAIDFFMLCVIMELGDLINPQVYKKRHWQSHNHDYNCLCTIHSHGLARELMKWWCNRYICYDPTEDKHIKGNHIFKMLLSQHINVLISYKKIAEEKDIKGEETECTANNLESLIQMYFPSVSISHEQCDGEGFKWKGAMYIIKTQPSRMQATHKSMFSFRLRRKIRT